MWERGMSQAAVLRQTVKTSHVTGLGFVQFWLAHALALIFSLLMATVLYLIEKPHCLEPYRAYIAFLEELNFTNSTNATMETKLRETLHRYGDKVHGDQSEVKCLGLLLTDAWWFTYTMMSTIGYGDVVPHTSAGKLVFCALAFPSIMLFTSCISTLSAVYLKVAHWIAFVLRLRSHWLRPAGNPTSRP